MKTSILKGNVMKKSLLAMVLFVAMIGNCIAADKEVFKPDDATSDIQINAVKSLIKRTAPELLNHFEISLIAQDGKSDVYELEQKGSKVALGGNNGVSLASAYNHYLREFCRCQYSLWGDQMKLPEQFPVVPEKVRKVCVREVRHFFNYCTLSYSAIWLDWQQWERTIDFLAMNGINMPLSTVGVEAVWYHTLLDIGLSDLESREFLAAPPFLNFQWMSCLDGTHGPLPKGYVDSHLKLGRQIMKRQLSLGMKPLVPGFTGHVPLSLKEKYPDGKIKQKRDWLGFTGTAKVEPSSPLFHKLGQIYLKNQIRLLGTGHYYSVDPFQESEPPAGVDRNKYLHDTGVSISSLISSVDPKGVWAVQDWSKFYPMWEAVEKNKLLIMDVAGGDWRQYKNKGYLFTVGDLNNFGGSTFMHGNLHLLARDIYFQATKESPNCVGTGNWSEGINDNPVYYHLSLEMNWANGPIDIKKWVKSYSECRYGASRPEFSKAWELLLKKVYTRGEFGFSSMIAARPSLNPPKSGPNISLRRSYYYDSRDLVKAWSQLLSVADGCKDSAGYRFDLADWGRQSLSNLAAHKQRAITRAFLAKDRKALARAWEEFSELYDDLDELVSSCPEMLMGKWQADAASWATNDKEKDYYLSVGATFPTIWGRSQCKPDDLDYCRIYDYAWREWGGLVKTFYKKRWH
ncbi:MAG: alpha-N-acetylglucosaminidase, partial [Desulfobulbaceae bacterium]|nr:alpha-N-acetylglucosaminidase [Desulfobulbaceae bacterium]